MLNLVWRRYNRGRLGWGLISVYAFRVGGKDVRIVGSKFRSPGSALRCVLCTGVVGRCCSVVGTKTWFDLFSNEGGCTHVWPRGRAGACTFCTSCTYMRAHIKAFKVELHVRMDVHCTRFIGKTRQNQYKPCTSTHNLVYQDLQLIIHPLILILMLFCTIIYKYFSCIWV